MAMCIGQGDDVKHRYYNLVMTVHNADPSRARFHSTTETYGQPDMSKEPTV
jgi:hypothetical protein